MFVSTRKLLLLNLLELPKNLLRSQSLSINSRKIVLDTETTGLNHYKDKIVSICAQEIINNKPGVSWHSYINPKKKSSRQAQICHKIQPNYLNNRPTFEEISNSFLSFIRNSTLIIHNAQFDIHFINSELYRINIKPLSNDVICTLKLSRKLYSYKKNTLDNLCDRYGIDRSFRDKNGHGAFIDVELLSQAYLKIIDIYGDNSTKKGLYFAPNEKWMPKIKKSIF